MSRLTRAASSAVAVLTIAAAAASTACSRAVTPITPPVPDARAAVDVWVTNSVGSQLLSRQPDLHFVSPPAATDVIDVDTTVRHQAIVGFGAAMTDASAFLISKLAPGKRDALMQELFGTNPGLGLGFVRVPMGASDFSLRQYSYDDMPAGQADSALANFSIAPDSAVRIPLLKQASAINPTLKLMGSPWSPPGWMKSTGSLIKGTLLPRYYQSFADYFRRFIQGYGAAGLPIYAVSLQNEPAYEPADYPGMRFDPADRATVIANYVGPTFAKAGIQSLILDWDHNWDMPQQPLAVLANADARGYVAGVAWHCYGGDVSAQSVVQSAYPDKDVYFTECSGGGWDTSFGSNLKWDVGTLLIDGTRNGARAVALWNLALDPSDGPHTGGCGNCRGVITIDTVSGAITRNVEYWSLAHASRFVRQGARRIDSSSGVDGLKSAAFLNADDGSVVLIVLNTNDADRTFAVHAGSRGFEYTIQSGAAATFHWK